MSKKTERGAEATSHKYCITPKKGTQEANVLEHLEKYGKVTNMDAFQYYRITRLGSVIHQLRKKGYDIDMYQEKSVDGKWYGVYTLRRNVA